MGNVHIHDKSLKCVVNLLGIRVICAKHPQINYDNHFLTD
jgi:hypothetical protein